MPVTRVFDSWALLAWLRGEPAAGAVFRALAEAEQGKVPAIMSWINVGETWYMLSRKNGIREADKFLKNLPALPVRLVTPGEKDIMAAAHLKAAHRLSYADAFAVALAIDTGGTVLTGDPEILMLRSKVKIEWIGAPA